MNEHQLKQTAEIYSGISYSVWIVDHDLLVKKVAQDQLQNFPAVFITIVVCILIHSTSSAVITMLIRH